MENFRQAVPTEYKGVVYRSKSEAVLARCFDLCDPDSGITFMYEPESLMQEDGWVPDFLLSISHVRRSRWEKPEYMDRERWPDELLIFMIEYKPSRPTEQYVKNLFARVNKYRENRPIPFPFGFQLMWGNLFDDNSERLIRYYTSEGFSQEEFTWKGLFGINEQVVQEARNYRFDLMH